MDLRDGFWMIPIHPDGQRYFGVRDPITQELMLATSLPFGWTQSPQFFCPTTQSVADRLMEGFEGRPFVLHRATHEHLDGTEVTILTGPGIKILCYVGDYLIIGDTYAECEEGRRVFCTVLTELGWQWAPHKQEGPSQVVVFLGVLTSCIPDLEGFCLPPDKVERYLAVLAEFRAAHRT